MKLSDFYEFKSKYTCPLYKLKDIPLPQIDETNPPKVLVNCSEIDPNKGDYLCCGKVPIRHFDCDMKGFPSCICEIPISFYVPCPCCGTGNTYVFKRKATGEVLMCCEECYTVWREEDGQQVELEVTMETDDEEMYDDAILLGFLMSKDSKKSE